MVECFFIYKPVDKWLSPYTFILSLCKLQAIVVVKSDVILMGSLANGCKHVFFRSKMKQEQEETLAEYKKVHGKRDRF